MITIDSLFTGYYTGELEIVRDIYEKKTRQKIAISPYVITRKD